MIISKKNIGISLVSLLFAVSAFSQKQKAVEIQLNYIQSPSIEVDPNWKYSAIVIQKNKAELLEKQAAYQAKVDKIEAEYEIAVEKADQRHQDALASYQETLTSRNEASTAEKVLISKPTEPTKPTVYKKKITRYFIPEPLDGEYLAQQYLDLKGFSKSLDEADFTLEVILEGFTLITSGKKQTDRQKEDGNASWEITYKNPFGIRVLDKSGNTIVADNYNDQQQTVQVLNSMKTYEVSSKWKSEQASLVGNIEGESNKKALLKADSMLNDLVGFPYRMKTLELYKAKHKRMDYTELDEAIAMVIRGFTGFVNDKDQAVKMLNDASAIWTKELATKSVADKSARINAVVASALYINLAYVSAILKDQEKARTYFAEAKTLDVGRFDTKISELEEFMKYANKQIK